MAVFGEAMALAESAGLNPRQVADILSNGAPGSPMVRGRAPMLLEHNYETRFALQLMHKDLTYALDEAARHTVPLPTVAAAREIYLLAIARGLGSMDFAAVSEALPRSRGTEKQ
jgi:3-hydroxyisobutyrate dehydrogenase